MQPLKRKIVLEPFQKRFIEQGFANAVFLAAQIGDIFFSEMRFLHPVTQPFQPGVNAVAGLVTTVVGITAEEVIELGTHLVQAGAKVNLCHGKLVLIRKQNTFGCCSVNRFQLRFSIG